MSTQVTVEGPDELKERMAQLRTDAVRVVETDFPEVPPDNQKMIAELMLLIAALVEGFVSKIAIDYSLAAKETADGQA